MNEMRAVMFVIRGLMGVVLCAGPAFAQAPFVAFPPQATAPAPAPTPATPGPPVFIPGVPVSPLPGTPGAGMWTPAVPLDLQPMMPWAGLWMDRMGRDQRWTAGAFAGQQGGERQVETMDLPFIDPSKPGALVVNLFSGSIRVKAANRKDVGIRVSHTGRRSVLPRKPEAPPAGMRRLTPASQEALAAQGETQGNQLVLRLMSPFVEADLELEVPARTNLNLRVVNGGAIEVEGVEGSLEVNNVNGPIRLQGVSGSVVADAVNGDVTVVMTRVAEQKVMAFSSLNGKLDVTLPRTMKANVKLYSDNGDVFTDFDVVQTPAPPAAVSATRSPQPFQWSGSSTPADVKARAVEAKVRAADLRGRMSRRVQEDGSRTIYGTINGGGPEIEARAFNGAVYIRRGPQ